MTRITPAARRYYMIHFERQWPRRHEAQHIRDSLRDNVRAQRWLKGKGR